MKQQYIPYDLDAEESVLGAVLLKPDSLSRIVDIILPDDFYKKVHGVIYEAMLSCYEKGEIIDPVILVDRIKKNSSSKVDSEEHIFNILKTVPSAANIQSYARIVKDKSLLRKLIDVSTNIAELASGSVDDVKGVLDKAENLVFNIAQKSERKELVHVKDLINNELARLEDVYKNKGSVTGISSGIKSLDKIISGFQKSDLIIVAARPSMGKTAFTLNIAYNASIVQKKKVLIFSLEMSDSQIFQRLVSLGSQVSLSKLKNGFLNEEEWSRVGLITSRLADSDLFVADTPTITVMEIRALCRRLKASHGLDLVVIDYMQLIKGYKSESRQQEMSEISRSLKGLARELDVPIIVASQLSRAPEQRADKHPMLSDLRDSGAIEQDADIVIFLYRDDYYNESSEERGLADIKIGKQRNGPTGNARVKFFNEFGRFADLHRESK
tara:strand:- start:2097 stop:3416 length:1320 start_codon:yes stop_codon:yes gene_type:complete